MKTCNNSQCSQVNPQPFSNFFRDKNNKTDGHYSICKICKGLSVTQWRDNNRHKYNENMRKYNAGNYQKHRLARYKLTPEQHAQMLLDQKGVCAICKKLPQGKRPLCVDHNHDTGKVRGLLCYGCNRALHVLETKELLVAALAYLDGYK